MSERDEVLELIKSKNEAFCLSTGLALDSLESIQSLLEGERADSSYMLCFGVLTVYI